MHAFTGCDTASSFAARRNLGELELLRVSRTYNKAYQQLVAEWNVSDLFSKMQEFVICMYASSTTICDINDLCYMYNLIYAKLGDVESNCNCL
jgi:hypothetical protein